MDQETLTGKEKEAADLKKAAARAQEEEDQRLWAQYKQTRDQRIKDALIMKYASFVKYVAGRIAVNLPSNVEFDDLVSYGILGLIDAIDKYDPERKVKFKTYAKTRIRGAIFDELRVLDWTPRSIRQKARKLEKAYAKLEGKLGRDATDEEIAEFLKIDISELHKLFDETKKSLLLSLDEIFYDDEEGSSRFDFVENQKSDNPQAKIEEAEAKQILADAISKLSERERMVITLYYYEDLTSKEIGKILGVSDSRVSQLHTKAILRLRGRLARLRDSLVED
ncbi:MAG: RNA polymerase sigma factor for flagellar operon [Candidatus Ozemobacter sibiricus]|uniref:RNA polymerase sigma factor n=1 Tax=Candidatus Ozemobacter sibiricus TaxID=2268124 RepID=A0A367ZIJ9_9BACT|nr:MAG: RNA polymerase sigma factor for flagellar operon [Candidatus Ozemobacter sibiricus]